MSDLAPVASETLAIPATSEGGWLCGPLGPALVLLRQRRRLKQLELVEASGLRRDLISAVETGRTRPSLDTLERMLEALEYNLADLQSALHAVADLSPFQPRPPRRVPDWLDGYAEQLIGILLRKVAERFGGEGLNQTPMSATRGGTRGGAE